jgi:hypothetical protein
MNWTKLSVATTLAGITSSLQVKHSVWSILLAKYVERLMTHK